MVSSTSSNNDSDNKSEQVLAERGEILVDSSTKKISSKTIFCIGIASQLILVSVFILIRLSSFQPLFYLHPWMSILGCCIVHLTCNLIFYEKFVIPTYEVVKPGTTSILEESFLDNDDESTVAPKNKIVIATFITSNVTVLFILYDAFNSVASSASASVLLLLYSSIYCCCLALLDISKAGHSHPSASNEK